MKIRIICLLIVLSLALTVSVSYARSKDLSTTSYLDRAQLYINGNQLVVDGLQKALNEARREKNMKKIECIEKRLIDIQKLAAEIEGFYNKMKQHSYNKQVPELRSTFAVLDQKQRIVGQLVNLVRSCLETEFGKGAFTETFEEILGNPELFGSDPTVDVWDPSTDWPDPLPPEYEPRPVSAAEDE